MSDSYVTRMSTDFVGPSQDDHLEFNTDDGTLASVSTGSGQAQGLVTMAKTGTFMIQLTVSGQYDDSASVVELYKNGAQVLSRDGKPIRILTDDKRVATDATEAPTDQGIFDLQVGDVLKAEITTAVGLITQFNVEGTSLVIIEVSQ